MLGRLSLGALAAAGALGLLTGSLSCTGLKVAEQTDGGDDGGATTPGDDGGSPGDGGDPGDSSAPVDAGPPPADFPCDGDAWTKATKTKPECAPRQVKIVDPDIVIDTTGISLARTPSGRVGLSYYSSIDGISGEMRVTHFVPTTSAFTPAILKHTLGSYDHAGYVNKIAASTPDELHVLLFDKSDADQTGDVVVRRLTNGAAPLSNAQAVQSGVKGPTELGFAVDGAGNSVATIRRPATSDGGAAFKLSAYTRPAGGAFTALPDISAVLLPGEAPGTGAASILADATGAFHLLYHHCEVPMHSTPRYHTLGGSSWSYRKTVDNAVIDGLAGYSPRVAVRGTRKYATYFFRKAGQGSPITADLRLATWELVSDIPVIEILDQIIPSPDAMYPRYRAAMAVDKYGLVHLAIVRPNANNQTGYLEYRRQTRDAGGTTKWLSDIVDQDVLSASSDAWVDFAVDDAARPHIAYVSGADLKVRYATRYDR